jgi:excisionase family DNA binding protein
MCLFVCRLRTAFGLQIGKRIGYHGRMSERDPRIPDLVSKAQAAEILGVSHQAVQLMIDKGRLKGAKVGSTWVFRRTAVEAFRKPKVDQ